MNESYRVSLSIEDIARAVAIKQAFDAGRCKAHASARQQAEPRLVAIRRAIDQDALRGFPERGRAVRIAKELRLPERSVRRAIGQLLLRGRK